MGYSPKHRETPLERWLLFPAAGRFLAMSAEKGFAAVLLLGLLSAAEAGIKTWVAEVPQNWNYNEGWSPAGVPTSADDVVFDGTGNGDCNLSGTVEVNSLNVTAAYNGTLALGNHDINIDAGNATFDGGYLTSTGGALVFRASTGTQTFSPKSGATYPGISKSGAGTVTVATNNLTAGSLSVSGGTWDWGASTSTHSVTSITTSGSSTMTFGANTVRVSGNVDLSGLATLNANSGTLELNGASAQTFTPMAGATHPTIKQTGTGTTTVATNSLTAQAVQVIAGTLDFSANALNLTTTGNVTVSGGTLTLTNSDAAVGGDFTVSGGTLDCPGYSKSFSVAGSFSWTTGNGTLNSGTLTLNGTATGKTLDFTGGSFYNLTVNGSGGVWTANTDITLNGSLTLTAGTLDISANATTLTAGYMTINGGTLTAGNGNLDLNGDLYMSSGTLTCPGSGKSFTLGEELWHTGGTLNTNGGTVTFEGTYSYMTLQSAATFNDLAFTGSGTWTVSSSGLTASTLSLSSGTLKLGSGLTHTLSGSPSFTGGTLEFGTSTLKVGGSTVNLNGLGNVTADSGYLEFTNTSATTFTPKYGATHPSIRQSGSGTTTVATYNLSTAHLLVPAGTFDLSTDSLDLTASGDVQVNGGTLTMTNSDATIAGDLNLSSGTLNCPRAGKSFLVGSNLVHASGGTLNSNSGTLTLNGTDTGLTINATGSGLHHLTLSGAGSTWTTLANLGIGGVFTLNAGTMNLSTNGFGLTTGGLTVSGGTLTADGADLDVNGDLSLSSGTLTCPGSGNTFTLTGNLTQTGGTFTPGTGTLVLDGAATGKILGIATAFNNLTVNGSGGAWTADSDVTVNDTFTLIAGSLDMATHALTVGGNVSVAGGTLIAAGGSLDINGDLAVSSGTLACPSGTFTVAGNVTKASGATWTHNNGTLALDGSATGKSLDIAGTLYNLTVNGIGGAWTVTNNGLIVANALSIAAGTLNLGSSLTSSVGSVTTSGGALDFGSSTLNITVGNAVFSGLGTLNAGSGTLGFTASSGIQSVEAKASTDHPHILHAGAGTLRLMNASMTCKSFTQSAGTFNFNAYNLTTVGSGNFTISNGNSASIIGLVGRILTVAGNAYFNGASSADRLALNPTSTWYLRVSGTAAAQLATIKNSSASGYSTVACTNCANEGVNANWTFAVGWDGGGADNNWSTAANWGSDYAPTADDDVIFNSTSKNVTLDVAATVNSITLTSGYTGAFSFSSNALTIDSGNADFRGGGSLAAGTGALVFTGSGSQAFYPLSGATFPAITQSGSGTTTIMANPLTAGNLSLEAGTFHLGTFMTHSVGAVSGSGGLNFGSSSLNATGNVDLSATSPFTASTSTTLAFTGTSAQTYMPKPGISVLRITQNGTGGTTLAGNVATGTLTLASGTLNLGSSLTHEVTALSISGGGLDFGSSTLKASGATVNLTNLSSLAAGSGTLEFTGTSAQSFTPKGGATHPHITQNGSGGTTVLTNDLTLGTLTLTTGAFNLGTSLTHTASGFSAGGGNLDFGSSTFRISGDTVNLNGLGTLTAGTGTLQFMAASGVQHFTPKSGVTHPSISHTGAGELELSTHDLTCLGFTQTAGTLDFGGRDITTTSGGHFTLSGGNSSSLVGLAGRAITVAGNASFSGAASTSRLNLDPASGWSLVVSGTLTASLASLAYSHASASAGTCSNCANGGDNTNWSFAVTWDGGGMGNNWTTAENWGSDYVPTALDAVTFDATSKSATLDADVSVKSITFTSGYAGTFDFGSATLTVNGGNADFRSGGAITAGTGTLAFTSASTQTFIPKASTSFPAITQNGSGGTTLTTHALTAGNLVLTAGTFNLGTSLTHTVAGVSGSGSLDFGTSNLNATGNVDLSGLTVTASSSNTLAFTGTSAQTYTPQVSVTGLNVSQNGSGGTTVAINGFTAPTLTIASGTLTLGTGLTHSATSALSISGGGLNFNGGTLKVAASTVDLRDLAALAGNGTLEFNGSSAQTFYPKASTKHPNVRQNGSGGTSVSTNSLQAGTLQIDAGTFNLGSGFTHTVAMAQTTGGGLTFNNSTLQIVSTTADFSGLASLTPGTGILEFTAASGTQTFTPNVSTTHPAVVHSGAGTLRLSTNALACASFSQSAGTLDFNGQNLTTSPGDFTLTNGGSASLAGLEGRTLTVAGDAYLNGTSTSNRLNLDPASAWSLAVTGSLTASLAEVAYGHATASAGTAANSVDVGGNTNWTFVTTWSGGGADDNWSTAANWGSGTAPSSTTNVLFDATSTKNATLDAAATVKSITFTSGYTGTFSFSTHTLFVTGNADFRGGGTIAAGAGTLSFIGAAAQTFTPKASTTFPNLVQNGSGGTTVAVNPVSAGSLTLNNGTLNLGSGFTHDVTSVSGSGGNLDFGGSTLKVTGNADLSGLNTLTAGTGRLEFTGASAQTFTPKNGATHPLILHAAAGGLDISTNALTCLGFTHTAGNLNLAGQDLTVSGSGNLLVSGATTTVSGLDSRILTVGGNARFAGTAAAKLGLDAASSWTLAVTGTLSAANVRLKNSAATGSTGVADSSVNLGFNTGWTFLDTVKPENVSGFLATAVGGTSVVLAWTPSVSEDADSVMLRYRADGTYPASHTDGTLWRQVSAAKIADTVTGLPDKTIHHFAAFVKDFSGNYSPAAAAARDSSRTPDVTPPANVAALKAAAITSSTAFLAWTPSGSPDADTVMIRYQIGYVHPSDTADGFLWRRLPVAATADTITGLAANTVYAFSLFTRDSSGNWSDGDPGARDTSLWQLPVSGSLSVADVAGLTRDADPTLVFSASGADSLRFAQLADTATAAWFPLRNLDSLNLGSADGRKILAAQFKNAFGRRSPWYLDTTVVDRGGPLVAIGLDSAHGRWTWPDVLPGTARDTVSGLDRISVIRRRIVDGHHFDGSAWVARPDTARFILAPSDTFFYASMPASAMSTGDYVFTAWAADRAGNAGPAATLMIHYEDNRAPVLAYSSIPDTVPQNAQASFAVGIGDADMGDSLVLISLDKPAWLTAAPDTGAAHFPARKAFSLTGKPGQTDVGSATVRIQLMDRGGLLHTYTKTLQVQDVNDPPAFADGQEKVAATEDSSTRWTPRFGDPDPSDSHTLILLNGPAFARLEGNEVVIRPGSRDIGSHALRLKVGDGRLADTLETILLVTNVNDPPYAFPSEGWRNPAFWKEDREEAFSVVVVDMDKGDALTLATPMPAFVKVTQSVDSSGINRIFQFVVKPTAKDTGALKSTLTFTDAAGATTQLALSARVLPDNDMPTALIAETRAHAGAARFRLDVKDEDGSLEQARFHYRLVGPAGDTVRRGITAAASLALHPLADGPYTLAVKAEDQDGLRQDSWTTAAFSISGATTLALDSALWHMIGVPQAQLPASAFGEGATLASWDETGDDGQPLSRYASGRAVEALRRGKGYWARLARPVTLTAAQKDLPSGAFALKLTRAKQGWNQVANPYPYWVDVSASRLTFWEWDAKRRDLVNAQGLLKPWAAYWVLAPRDTTLILPDQPWFPAAEALAKSARAAGTPGSTGVTFANPGDWSARLSLRAGAYHDAANLFGVRGARGAYRAGSVASRADAAPGDRALPDAPKFGDYLALHFEKTAVTEVMAGAAQGYATDFRDSLNREEEWWDFSVEDAGTGETQAFLSPEGLEPLHAAGLKVFLVRRGEARAVEPGQAVALSLEQARTHYSLVVTPHADFAGRLKGDFSISQNFPNPVTTHTAFRFVLPQTWDAEGRRITKDFKLRIKVYDYSGREVAQVASGTFRPGAHTLPWKPTAASGSRLVKGAYIYRLETAGFRKSLKMLLE